MAHLIKSFPTLTGEAARKFLEEAEKVDKGLSQQEKDQTLNRLRRAFKFIQGENNLRPIPQR